MKIFYSIVISLLISYSGVVQSVIFQSGGAVYRVVNIFIKGVKGGAPINDDFEILIKTSTALEKTPLGLCVPPYKVCSYLIKDPEFLKAGVQALVFKEPPLAESLNILGQKISNLPKLQSILIRRVEDYYPQSVPGWPRHWPNWQSPEITEIKIQKQLPQLDYTVESSTERDVTRFKYDYVTGLQKYPDYTSLFKRQQPIKKRGPIKIDLFEFKISNLPPIYESDQLIIHTEAIKIPKPLIWGGIILGGVYECDTNDCIDFMRNIRNRIPDLSPDLQNWAITQLRGRKQRSPSKALLNETETTPSQKAE